MSPLKTTPQQVETARLAWEQMEWGDARCDVDHEAIAAVIHDAGQAHVMSALVDRLERALKALEWSGHCAQSGNIECPSCRQDENYPHHDNCGITASLATVQEWRAGK